MRGSSGFGLSRVLIELHLMESPSAYSVMAAAILIDACLLYRVFQRAKSGLERPASAGALTALIASTRLRGEVEAERARLR